MSEFLLGEPEPMPTAPAAARPTYEDFKEHAVMGGSEVPTESPPKPGARPKPTFDDFKENATWGGSRQPVKLTHDNMVEKWQNRGYPKGAAEGIADNMMRESGGDPMNVGDHGTSVGLFQHHNERKTALEAFGQAGIRPRRADRLC